MKWISTALILSISVTLISCNDGETDDLAKAQKCLDEVPQTAPANAKACLPYVAKYTSQQANILKCSIYMTSGGLVENKIVSAYKAVDNDSNSNREVAFMGILALDVPNVTEGYDTAVTADTYCQLTGVPGLQYISSIVKIGSNMAKLLASSGVDFSNPDSVATAVSDLVAKCNTDPRTAECSGADLAGIGASAATLSEGYCASDNADSEVCENINAAVTAAGGDSSIVGDALMCYLGNKTFNTTTKKCNP